MPDYDNMSLSEIFKLDSSERIKTLNELVLKLEKDPKNDILYDDAMREAHSLKAAARIVNSSDIQNLAHKMEEVFEVIKQKKCLNSEYVDLFFANLDAISTMAEAFAAGHTHDVDLENLFKRLEDAKQGHFHPKTKESQPAPTASKDAEPKKLKGKKIPLVLPGEDHVEARSQEGLDSTKRRLGVEKAMVEKELGDLAIRVGIEKLDKLMNLSGEIYAHTLNLQNEREQTKQLKEYLLKVKSNFGMLKVHLQETGIESKRLQEWIFKNQNDLEDLDKTLALYFKRIEQMSFSFGYLGTQLQDEVMRSRMLPVSAIFDSHLRFVRDSARESGKKISLIIEGGQTPVDRGILETLKDPLMHLIRNACDHGIESPQIRQQSGKNEEGMVKLSAYQHGDRVMIAVEDDGRGIDSEHIKKKAIEKNLITEEKANQLSRREILNFVYLPGFSTAEKVTTLSGRGVGLDVVKCNLIKINGQIQIETEKGKFTRFILSLPLTLAVTKSLLIKSGGEIFCLPLTRIEAMHTVSSENFRSVEGKETVDLRGGILPVVYLAGLWGMDEPNKIVGPKRKLVVIGQEREKVALCVDDYLGEKEIVGKPLDRRLSHWQDLSGVTVLEDGQVAFVVDTESLTRSSAEYTGQRIISQEQEAKAAPRKKILVVEDSLTVRELEKKVLQNNGYEVETAVDGIEGFNKAKESKFDLIITDIEMPRMDGFELIGLLKKNEELKDIPTIIVSYKERDEDKRRGIEVGADKYITKSKYNDDILLEAVAKLIA